MNILSLFDGMSCGQIALNRAGVKYDNYYASEIDKHAISVTQDNYPNTKQLGDVLSLKGKDLPKIDLLIGGSPCQSFSVAGDGSGFDGKSKLFWEFVRIMKETKPKYFLLENVKMKKEWQDIITKHLGVEPIEINSALVSAQHRRRLYWTNIPNVTVPDDKKITLKSILENSVEGEKKYGDFKANNGKTIRIENQKFPYTFYEARTEEGKAERRRLRQLTGKDTTPRGPKYKIYLPLRSDKSNCIVATPSQLDYIVDKKGVYRKLTINEIEALQTVPKNYTKVASESQRRRMLGNGWTVDVISHIFSNLVTNK
jgi:DNA (cytosine-5)-methyltransferase 3A